MKEQFADDWITEGWSRVNGVWVEMGQSKSVKVNVPSIPPELTLHDVVDKLNELESRK